MVVRSILEKHLGPAALVLLAALTAANCGGSDETRVTGSSGAGTGQGGSGGGQGGAGAGQGGSGAGQTGSGGGGQGECDPAVTTCPCSEDGACPGELQCVGGLCIDGCNFSYECGPGQVCANGQCATGCDDETPCPEAGTACENGVCVPDPQNPACTDDIPCPSGEICVNGICSASCATNADCPDGEVCNGSTGACIPDPSAAPGCEPTGDPCSGIQECMTDGYCHYACTTTEECKLIDNRFFICDLNVCKTEEEYAPECTLDNPCPQGQDCISNECL